MSPLNIVRQGQYQIAAGWNNAAGLTGLEGVMIANDFIPFKTFESWSSFSPGDPITRGDGTIVYDGYPSVVWTFGAMTKLQLQYLQDTYCGGSYSGKVTIRTATDNVNSSTAQPSFENYNAIMRLIPPTNARRYYLRYPITFLRLVAI